MMIESQGIVKPLPPSDKKDWELKKTEAGIPFVTNGVDTKWAISFFQEAGPSQKIGSLPALPSLDGPMVASESSDADAGAKPATEPQTPAPANPGETTSALPGVKSTTSTGKLESI